VCVKINWSVAFLYLRGVATGPFMLKLDCQFRGLLLSRIRKTIATAGSGGLTGRFRHRSGTDTFPPRNR